MRTKFVAICLIVTFSREMSNGVYLMDINLITLLNLIDRDITVTSRFSFEQLVYRVYIVDAN